MKSNLGSQRSAVGLGEEAVCAGPVSAYTRLPSAKEPCRKTQTTVPLNSLHKESASATDDITSLGLHKQRKIETLA